MFNVCLSNSSCIFDSCNGFDTVQEALDWASGRGGTYVVQIAREVNGEEVSFLSVAADNRRGSKTRFSRQMFSGWVTVTAEDIALAL